MTTEKSHDERVAECQKSILALLESENEVEKIKNMIRNNISGSNWNQAVWQICSKRIDEENINDLTPESLANLIADEAFEAIPTSIHESLEKYIVEILTKKQVQERPPE